MKTYTARHLISVDHSSTFRHCPQQTNRNRREDSQAFLDTRIHVGQGAEDVHIQVCLGFAGGAELVLQFLEDDGVA
jgi:hypothetical protein